MPENILHRLDHEPSYCENCDAKQLRRDAAEEIRRLLQVIENLHEAREREKQA